MLTKFQELTNFFKSYNGYSNDKNLKLPSNTIIAQTRNREEFEMLLKQKRQLKYIQSQWRNNKNIINQNYLQVESLRLPAYYDYDIMSNHELIGRALEIYAQEVMTKDAKKNAINIRSSNKKIKNLLETLFYNVLNVNINGYSWAYQAIKNGDCFLHLDIDDERGIVGVKQLPAIHMERIENDYINSLISNDKDEITFRWKENAIVEFKYWSIGHIRLLLDDRKMPYGTSLLEKARRLWRNVLLAEDAMLSIAMIRGIDRLIFSVDVGTIDPDAVDQYVQDFASNFKRTSSVDPSTGQRDLKDMIHGIDQDYFIPKRGSNDASKIEKLEGKSEMDTNVVDYLMKKLVATLGIPLTYLNMEDRSGADKTLAMQDVNVAKTVGRIQESILTEFNKMAMIHLLILGYEDELDNFELSFNTPSIQEEMMRLELLEKRISLYQSATDPSNGISAYSVTRAKQEILGFSGDDIMLDMKQQRLEKAAIGELEVTNQIIPKSGIFDEVDAIYGNPDANPDFENADTPEQLGGGGGGGFSGGSSLDDMGGDGLSADDLSDDAPTDDATDDSTDLNADDATQNTNVNDSLMFYIRKINKLLTG